MNTNAEKINSQLRKKKLAKKKKSKKEKMDEEMEFLDEAIHQATKEREGIQEHVLMFDPWLKSLKNEKNDYKKFGHQLVNFTQLVKRLASRDQFEKKIKVLKDDYPAIYIEYCEKFHFSDELENYV